MKVSAGQTWCLTSNGERVPEGHPLARFLLVAKGCEIEQSELESHPILEEPKPAEPQKIDIQIDEEKPEPPPPEPEAPPPKPKRRKKPAEAEPPKPVKVTRPRPPKGPPAIKGKTRK